MARTEATLSCITLAQDFRPEHWPGWTDEEKKLLGVIEAMGRNIKKRLEAGGCVLLEMYGIKHDKDEHKLWDEYNMAYKLHFGVVHAHYVIKFASGRGETLKKLAELIGITPNYIEKPRRGRFSYDNMLSYLLHIKYPEKYQYEPQAVVTLAGSDYMVYYREQHEAWMRGRAKKIIKNAKDNLDSLLTKIVEDDNFNLDDIAKNDDYKKIYTLHSSKIDKALDARNIMLIFRGGAAKS